MVDGTQTACSYLVYLILLRKVETEDGPAWRVVLEDAHSAQRWGFADLPSLYRFLDERTDAALDLICDHTGHIKAKRKET